MRGSDRPVFENESQDLSEVLGVAGDDGEAMHQRSGGDSQVARADADLRGAQLLELRLAVRIEEQHLRAGESADRFPEVAVGNRSLGGGICALRG